MLTKYFNSIWDDAMDSYERGILSMIEANPLGRLLDLGCDDGNWTKELAKKMGIGKGNIYGIDLIEQRYKWAIKRGVKVRKSDLNKRFPFRDKYFDVIHANQVIEHIWSLDNFVTETKRVLKDDGYAIICTENLSSWHNIFALILGLQPFSLTNVSEKGAIGNPFVLKAVEGPKYSTWQHTRVLTWRGLRDIFEIHGFEVVGYRGYGYFPLPPFMANILSRIDPRHSAFPLIKVRKLK